MKTMKSPNEMRNFWNEKHQVCRVGNHYVCIHCFPWRDVTLIYFSWWNYNSRIKLLWSSDFEKSWRLCFYSAVIWKFRFFGRVLHCHCGLWFVWLSAGLDIEAISGWYIGIHISRTLLHSYLLRRQSDPRSLVRKKRLVRQYLERNSWQICPAIERGWGERSALPW